MFPPNQARNQSDSQQGERNSVSGKEKFWDGVSNIITHANLFLTLGGCVLSPSNFPTPSQGSPSSPLCHPCSSTCPSHVGNGPFPLSFRSAVSNQSLQLLLKLFFPSTVVFVSLLYHKPGFWESKFLQSHKVPWSLTKAVRALSLQRVRNGYVSPNPPE